MEIVTATITNGIHRFSMPILLPAIVKESKGTAFQVVMYLETTGLSRKTIHEETRIRTESIRSIGVIFVDRSGPSRKNESATKI
jgi:hypothetical protein